MPLTTPLPMRIPFGPHEGGGTIPNGKASTVSDMPSPSESVSKELGIPSPSTSVVPSTESSKPSLSESTANAGVWKPNNATANSTVTGTFCFISAIASCNLENFT